MRFADPKSRRQAATFHTYELHAARWRNAKNLERWTDACRSRWELENVGKATRKAPIDYDAGMPIG